MDFRVAVFAVTSLALVGCESSADVGGRAGDGSVGDATGVGDCTDFSQAEALWGAPRDLLVVGSGVASYEGETVRLVITNGEPHYGLAETTIKDGAFEFSLPGSVGNYTGLGAYIDLGKDDACTLGVDVSWQMTTGGDTGPVTWEITPNWQPPSGSAPCNINGIFDIMMTLPCPR